MRGRLSCKVPSAPNETNAQLGTGRPTRQLDVCSISQKASFVGFSTGLLREQVTSQDLFSSRCEKSAKAWTIAGRGKCSQITL